MSKKLRIAFGGGGNRSVVRNIVREAAKQLRSEAARCGLDAKTQRGIEAKSVTEINFVNSSDDHESIVGWAFQPNNEKSIQPYPSPEFLNSLSFIKKFYPLPFGARVKFTKGTHEAEAVSCHSERLAKESSLLQYKAAAKNENNSTETIYSPLTTHHSLKKSAFTLAEVLITLGIIGVVAALTLPSVIQNYRKQVILNKIKRTYTVLNNTIERAKADYGTNVNEWYIPSGDNRTKSMYFVENYMLPYLNVLEYCKDQSLKPICKEVVHYFNTTYEVIGPATSYYGTNFILTDGTNVYVNVGRINGSESMDTKRVMVDFDIDGVNSGKNTYGYDVFRVELGGDEGYNLKNNADKNKFLPYRYIPGDSCDYYVGTQPHSCNKKAITGGSMCLAYIVCNGWSFGDKYPW